MLSAATAEREVAATFSLRRVALSLVDETG